MDGDEIKELRKYIESLGEVIRKYPRKGGKYWKKYGGNRRYKRWRCMPSKD